MAGDVQRLERSAWAQAEELLCAIATAEEIIVSTIERECEALRAGQMLAAKALRTRLGDSARFYSNAMRAARASIMSFERLAPGIGNHLNERRRAFASLLRVELGVLAAERAAFAEAAASSAKAGERARRAVSVGRPTRRSQAASAIREVDEPTVVRLPAPRFATRSGR
jgi:hypothetical protein